MRSALLGLVCLLSLPAAAQEGGEDKKPALSVALSAASSLASYAVFAGGVAMSPDMAGDHNRGWPLILAGALGAAIAPSAGHLYAGATGHAALTSSGRALSLGAVVYGIAGMELDPDEPAPGYPAAPTIGVLGVVSFVGLSLYDLGDSGFVVQRRAGEALSLRSSGPGASPALVYGVGGLAGVAGAVALGRSLRQKRPPAVLVGPAAQGVGFTLQGRF